MMPAATVSRILQIKRLAKSSSVTWYNATARHLVAANGYGIYEYIGHKELLADCYNSRQASSVTAVGLSLAKKRQC